MTVPRLSRRSLGKITGLGAALLLLGTATLAQDRTVSFVPGLGQGGDNVWQTYEEMFEMERQMNGLRSERIATGTPIADQSTRLAADVVTRAPAGDVGRVLGIGHSNGGLVLREEDRVRNQGDQVYNAIVTVGTPNHGAAISNAIITGEAQRELERGCRALAAGPISEITVLPVVHQQMTNFVFCGVMRNFVIDPLVGRQVDREAARDAAVGSPFLTTLAAAPPRVPIVSVHGNEERPVHWRLASSNATDNRDDGLFVGIANEFRIAYGLAAAARLTNGITSFLQANPFSIIKGAYRTYQATQYLRGERWIANSEQTWLDVIRCEEDRVYETFTVRVIYEGCRWYETGSADWVTCINQNCGGNAGCVIEVERQRSVTINDSSDGFVCQGTQVFDPFDEPNIYEAEGVNHSDETNTTRRQTRNGNDEMRRVLIEIFDRDDEFEVDPI